MLKRGKSLKIALLLVGVYAAFLTVLLTGISSAKYQETRIAYTNFGAASFNTVILGRTQEETMAEKYKVFNVFADPLELSNVSGYRPGMIYNEDIAENTAREIPFSVANGVTGENASDASVQYEIFLRTTGQMPLKYTLKHDGKLYAAGEKEKIEPDTVIGTAWYEQKFYEETADGSRRGATFDLDGGALRVNDYSLIVEWPVETADDGQKTNDVKYMKEVDLLELFVTVSSKNMLDEPNYGGSVTIQEEPGTGLVILDPSKGETFIHTVDYRAFDAEEGTTSYSFVIENGAEKGIAQNTTHTSYTFEIEVPWTSKTQSFQYRLQDAEGEELILSEAGYRLYDVLYSHERYNGNGGYKRQFEAKDGPTQADIEAWSAPGSQYKLYKVFRYSHETTLENAAHAEKEYRLVLTGAATNGITDEMAYANKIEILVDAKYIGNPLAQSEEGGGADD